MPSRTAAFDDAKMHAFGDRLVRDTAAMLLGNLAYIGDQLGLFKLLAQSGPVTPDQLADLAACNARYIREWLSAMAAAGWLEYEAAAGRFTLPPEHVPFLADENHPMHFGGALQCIIPLAHVAPRILECFRHGGGVGFAEHHPDMPRVIERFSAPMIHNFLTKVWLTELLPQVHQRLREGGDAADVGCGSGRALVELAKAYPQSRFTGYEPHAPSAARAQALAQDEGVAEQVHIVNARSDAMPTAAYDFISTLDVVHDSIDPQGLIKDIRRALRPEGTYLMLEINASSALENNLHSLGAFFYAMSTLYCMTVSLAHGGAGIGTCMGEELPREMCAQAGFSHFRKLDFAHPFAVLYEVRIAG
jgi:SAM-dependent methyltransferase